VKTISFEENQWHLFVGSTKIIPLFVDSTEFYPPLEVEAFWAVYKGLS